MILQRINNKSGFTLIELMIVIAIVAILAAVFIPFAASILQGTDGSSQIEIIDQDEEAAQEAVEPEKTQEQEEEKL